LVREEIKKLILKAIAKTVEIKIEKPEREEFGDYSTNIALQLKKDPDEIAKKLKAEESNARVFEKIEVVPPGFINFFVSKEYLQKQVEEILKEKEKFGTLKIGKNKKVNVEFVSANPTGPLHIGNGRGGFCGDVLANIFQKAGYRSSREYYINDMGRQIETLKNSLEGKEPCYKNPYIDELKKKKEKNTKRAVKFIVDKIKKTAESMGIEYDKWFYESKLYPKETNKVLKLLKKKKLIYEKEGAVWFRSTKFGDDKDRVLIKKDGEKTYILSDLAYLKNKFERKFDCLIIFLGAEHHGYVGRLKAGAEALGYDRKKVKPIVFQLVKLVEKGKQVRMSKRTGVYVTVDELLDEIKGKDVARFFFLTRNYGNHLSFNLDLAKQQSEKNPVYYVQYAYARICSIIRKSKIKEAKPQSDLLEHPSELKLIKNLIRLPEIVEDTAHDYQVQRLPQYAMDLAAVFHQFYRDCRVISEDKELTKSRLVLVRATKIVLKNTLDLMGITSPEKM